MCVRAAIGWDQGGRGRGRKRAGQPGERAINFEVEFDFAKKISGTTPSTSPSPFHARGDREGGVVTVTSRDIITQHN